MDDLNIKGSFLGYLTPVIVTHTLLLILVVLFPTEINTIANASLTGSGIVISGSCWLLLIFSVSIFKRTKPINDETTLTSRTTTPDSESNVSTPIPASQQAHSHAKQQTPDQAWQSKLSAVVDEIAESDRISKWSGWREFVIAKKRIESEDGTICSFFLEPYDKKVLPRFSPGQFLTFKLTNIPNSKTVTRCYSLSDSFQQNYYRVSIKKQPSPRDKPDIPPGLSSNHFHNNLNEGDMIQLKAPAGHFYLQETSPKGVILIAGGVGVTPMVSMLKHLAAQNSKREVFFFYGVSKIEELALLPEIEQNISMLANAQLVLCVSRHDGSPFGEHTLHLGRVSVDLFKQRLPSSNYEYYLCGPGPFMETIVTDLESWNVPKQDIHFEAFGPASVKKKKTVTGSFAITYKDSNEEHNWSGEENSLLEFTEQQNIEMASGCRMGNCGACMTKLVEGSVDYPNGEPNCESLSPGCCLPCVAVPNSNLTLEA